MTESGDILKIDNTFIYLIGPPGVGKYTVAQSLAKKSGAKLVDNHYWSNVVLGLVEQDGKTPLTSGIFDNALEVCKVVVDTVARYSPPDWSFVFTHAACAEGDERDREFSQLLLDAAKRRAANSIVVNLRCTESELLTRVTDPERRSLMKDVNPKTARLANMPNYVPEGFDKYVDIDTTGLAVEETMDQILKSESQCV